MPAFAAAIMVTGCCGTKHESTTTYYQSPATTATETPRTYAADETRTNVRENMTGNEWSMPLYSESLRVGTREIDNGSVRLRKTVHTENATQPIDLRRETVVIDREAFDQARKAAEAGQPNNFGMAFQEKEITIDLKRDEPVVEVQPFVSGRIVAQKRVQTDHQNISRQVRREEVEVIKTGNDITVSERVRPQNEAGGAPGNMQNRQTGTGTSNQNLNQTNPDDIDEPTEPPLDPDDVGEPSELPTD